MRVGRANFPLPQPVGQSRIGPKHAIALAEFYDDASMTVYFLERGTDVHVFIGEGIWQPQRRSRI